MRTYDKLIATIRAAKARGGLRTCLGAIGAVSASGPLRARGKGGRLGQAS